MTVYTKQTDVNYNVGDAMPGAPSYSRTINWSNYCVWNHGANDIDYKFVKYGTVDKQPVKQFILIPSAIGGRLDLVVENKEISLEIIRHELDILFDSVLNDKPVTILESEYYAIGNNEYGVEVVSYLNMDAKVISTSKLIDLGVISSENALTMATLNAIGAGECGECNAYGRFRNCDEGLLDSLHLLEKFPEHKTYAEEGIETVKKHKTLLESLGFCFDDNDNGNSKENDNEDNE